MKKLTIEDFKTEKVGLLTYRTFVGKNCEICIEPGFKCLDVAVYDLEKGILEPKVTINAPEFKQGGVGKIVEYLKQFESTVNNFYKKWELKK